MAWRSEEGRLAVLLPPGRGGGSQSGLKEGRDEDRNQAITLTRKSAASIMMENVDVSEKLHRNNIDVDQNVKHSRKTKKNKKHCNSFGDKYLSKVPDCAKTILRAALLLRKKRGQTYD